MATSAPRQRQPDDARPHEAEPDVVGVLRLLDEHLHVVDRPDVTRVAADSAAKPPRPTPSSGWSANIRAATRQRSLRPLLLVGEMSESRPSPANSAAPRIAAPAITAARSRRRHPIVGRMTGHDQRGDSPPR